MTQQVSNTSESPLGWIASNREIPITAGRAYYFLNIARECGQLESTPANFYSRHLLAPASLTFAIAITTFDSIVEMVHGFGKVAFSLLQGNLEEGLDQLMGTGIKVYQYSKFAFLSLILLPQNILYPEELSTLPSQHQQRAAESIALNQVQIEQISQERDRLAAQLREAQRNQNTSNPLEESLAFEERDDAQRRWEETSVRLDEAQGLIEEFEAANQHLAAERDGLIQANEVLVLKRSREIDGFQLIETELSEKKEALEASLRESSQFFQEAEETQKQYQSLLADHRFLKEEMKARTSEDREIDQFIRENMQKPSFETYSPENAKIVEEQFHQLLESNYHLSKKAETLESIFQSITEVQSYKTSAEYAQREEEMKNKYEKAYHKLYALAKQVEEKKEFYKAKYTELYSERRLLFERKEFYKSGLSKELTANELLRNKLREVQDRYNSLLERIEAPLSESNT
ncbi:MAG: hypothetical protein KAR79_05905 [Simkaniaceae bacterium]|nr:hypothetical protein [Simkaniaceae bacterium]